MIRVVLPPHLRTLARVDGELELNVDGTVTQRSILDAIEAKYPMLRGTIRDHVTLRRRAFVRFFACEQDLSHESMDAVLPETVAKGTALTLRQPGLPVGPGVSGFAAGGGVTGSARGSETAAATGSGLSAATVSGSATRPRT